MGACHSNGHDGAPAVTPCWAGGTWTAGSCANCHDATPTSGHHTKRLGGEGFVVACTNCHPAANTAAHVDRVRDVLTSISGALLTGSVTSNRFATGCKIVQCSGSCHGEDHGSYCW